MFSQPQLATGEHFPELPMGQPEWGKLLTALEVELDTSPAAPDDSLTQLTRHAIGWVERLPPYVKPWHEMPIQAVPTIGPLLRKAGLLDRIDPQQPDHDYALIDGGNMSKYRIRLAYEKQLQSEGLLKTPHIVVFGGQSLRSPTVDRFDQLRLTAGRLLPVVDSWAYQWLNSELSKCDQHPNPWQRPFATEREIGLLCLLDLYPASLHHMGTYIRPHAESIDPSIPPATTAADDFDLNGQRVTLLNAPAKVREHAGRKLPLNQARPTGRSCFYEWLRLDNPPLGSSVLLVTHAPNIYRSWLDMVLRAAEASRQELHITAAGAALELDKTVGDVLEGLGNLIINFYNHTYEGGIDSPPSTPFRMSPTIC